MSAAAPANSRSNDEPELGTKSPLGPRLLRALADFRPSPARTSDPESAALRHLACLNRYGRITGTTQYEDASSGLSARIAGCCGSRRPFDTLIALLDGALIEGSGMAAPGGLVLTRRA
jgi:hypothetical protein